MSPEPKLSFSSHELGGKTNYIQLGKNFFDIPGPSAGKKERKIKSEVHLGKY